MQGNEAEQPLGNGRLEFADAFVELFGNFLFNGLHRRFHGAAVINAGQRLFNAGPEDLTQLGGSQ